MTKKKSHSSIGISKKLIFEICILLNPHILFFVKTISHGIKKIAVSVNAGINAFILEKYLNLESHEAASGKEIVKISKIKYKLI
tara:strand:- start:1396 stop:1647 length:252 start_codon:yes stop_codon:yes gene_type:complete